MTTLGPIGHLPVDQARARDAAAGPRITAAPQDRRYYFGTPITTPTKRRTPEPDLSWMDDAACKGMDADLFFPERGDIHTTNAAKAVCRSCPARTQCLNHALDNHEGIGVWGGTSASERHTMWRNRRRAGVA
jgi:WhiB family redox-sensing transcriptional regulator